MSLPDDQNRLDLDRSQGGPDHPADQPPAPAPGPQDDVERGNVEEPIGNDNIRDGTVRGVMGGPRAQEGEGQG